MGHSKNLKKQEIHEQYLSKRRFNYFEDLIRRTASDKILSDKAFNIVSNKKYDGY